jgi:hypothetical protein
MPTGYEQVRPLKSIIQSNGEVILAEFTDDDFISIESGGTSATNKIGARVSLEVIKYNEYQNLSSFEDPTSSQLALNYDDGKMYYSHNNEWIKISDTLAKHSTDTGFNNVESFIFNNRFITLYNDGILEVDLYIDDITDRLDIIEGDVNISGSILHTVQENIDLLLDGVIPELDTLKEIATSLGDAVDIKVQLDTETTNRITNDNILTSNLTILSDKINIIESDVNTSGSILHTVQENIDLLLDGVIPELDTLKEIATSLGDTVDFKSQYDITVSDLSALNTKVDDIDSQVGNSEQILSIVQEQIDNFKYTGHDSVVLNDTHPTGLMLDKQTGKYKPSLLNMGHFIPFKRKNNDVDDINLISTFDGDILVSSTLRFWQHDGTSDNISLILQ